MSNNINIKTPVDLAKIGNFTKNAVETFENGIINEHNYLEKVNKNLNKYPPAKLVVFHKPYKGKLLACVLRRINGPAAAFYFTCYP